MTNNETNVILDDGNLSELEGRDEEDGIGHGLTATETSEAPDRRGIEFFVQLKHYQFDDIETAIVHAAASQLLGRQSDRAMAKAIEERCLELLSAKIDAALEPVVKDVLDRPMLADPYSKKDPVTLREFIGLVGRDFLETRVDSQGKPSTSTYDTPRIQRLVSELVSRDFQTEITKETRNIVNEVRTAIKSEQTKILNAEKQRVLDAVRHSTEVK